MDDNQISLLLESSARFPPPPGHVQTTVFRRPVEFFIFFEVVEMDSFSFAGVTVSYGTAGFRADASILQSTVFRVGILAALRSLKTQSVIGLMITASHNKVSDNGVKVADPSGGMLSQDWEPFADQLANAPDPQSLVSVRFGLCLLLT